MSKEVRLRSVLSRVADETEARGLSPEVARALIDKALPGIAWADIEAAAQGMTAALERDFDFYDELQLLCGPVWLDFPKLDVHEAIALLASRGDLRAVELLAADQIDSDALSGAPLAESGVRRP